MQTNPRWMLIIYKREEDMEIAKKFLAMNIIIKDLLVLLRMNFGLIDRIFYMYHI
jgi:hypothetical protein